MSSAVPSSLWRALRMWERSNDNTTGWYTQSVRGRGLGSVSKRWNFSRVISRLWGPGDDQSSEEVPDFIVGALSGFRGLLVVNYHFIHFVLDLIFERPWHVWRRLISVCDRDNSRGGRTHIPVGHLCSNTIRRKSRNPFSPLRSSVLQSHMVMFEFGMNDDFKCQAVINKQHSHIHFFSSCVKAIACRSAEAVHDLEWVRSFSVNTMIGFTLYTYFYSYHSHLKTMHFLTTL